MTDPSPTHDPLSAILVAVTRTEELLRSVVGKVDKHETRLDGHDVVITEHGNRIVRLETQDQRDTQHDQRTISLRAVVWSAVAAVCAVIGIILALRTGG